MDGSEFVWVRRYDCPACGAEATTTATAGPGVAFRVCADCGRPEARARQ